jgi:hypothetical protein
VDGRSGFSESTAEFFTRSESRWKAPPLIAAYFRLMALPIGEQARMAYAFGKSSST